MLKEPVLIVDDNKMHLRLAKTILETEGFKVLTAGDVPEAKSILNYFHPALVITDYSMPGPTGIELAHWIKMDPRTKGIKVVLMTSYLPEDLKEESWEEDCDGFLSKPIDSKCLTEKIEDYLGSRK